MNSEFIKFRTCYVLDAFGDSLEELAKELPEDEADKINEFLGFIFELNQKHVKLCKEEDD